MNTSAYAANVTEMRRRVASGDVDTDANLERCVGPVLDAMDDTQVMTLEDIPKQGNVATDEEIAEAYERWDGQG